ncbi:hypothetical protein RJT34_09009 [Clitoria ternatea]|uniref:Uncharacterized protein n=1 Tax=Clitoria ternatea TaxID=43366 RepID=A0AAN9PUY1_CLITE
MAASTYPINWDTLQVPTNNSEISTSQETAQNHHHLFDPYSDESFFLSNPLFENYLDPSGGFLYHEEMFPYHNELIPFTSSYDPFISLTHHTLLPCPKRQKYSYEDQAQEYLQYSLPPLNNPLDEFVVPNIN